MQMSVILSSRDDLESKNVNVRVLLCPWGLVTCFSHVTAHHTRGSATSCDRVADVTDLHSSSYITISGKKPFLDTGKR